MKGSLRRSAHAALALALLLASNVVSALGLGQLEMKSKIGEPFLAEIPIISSDPAELEQLEARVPSAETFARIGLQGPDEIVSSLRFVSALDAQGRPIIRVTSEQPINEPLLTFLVEVDWGQGRLVREYSALVAAPRTVDAPLQPAIQAPVAAPSNAIVREPVTPPPPPVVSATPVVAPAPTPTAQTPPPTPPPLVAAPVPMPAPAEPPATPGPSAIATRTIPVERGDSLSEIAGKLDLGVSLDQAMVALLRANPDAFINGDINQLKRGAVLRVPASAELSAQDAQEASELVRTQMARFQESRRPVVAPEAPAQDASAAGVAAAAPPATSAPEPSTPTTASAPPVAATPRRNRARLEIVPPGASQARQAGTQSGVAAGGEGAMLRQEMDQARETLAARDVELNEMRARVAELEKLQAQQTELIALKDSQLATAQQRMAQAQQAPAAPAAESSALPWLLGGGVLLALLAMGAFLARRQAHAREFRPPPAGPSIRPRSIADSFAEDGRGVHTPGRRLNTAPDDRSARSADAAIGGAAMVGSAGIAASESTARREHRSRSDAQTKAVTMSGPLPPMQAGPRDVPLVPPRSDRAAGISAAISHTGNNQHSSSASPVPPVTAGAASTTPTWHATSLAGVAAGAAGADADATDPAPVPDSSRERLELAQAYLDLGDHASARQLLVELRGNGDQAYSAQASRLLRELD